jgi:Zinc knuckle
VSRPQTLLTRTGTDVNTAENIHRFLHGLPAEIATQIRLKFAGISAPLPSYIETLCAVPDRSAHAGAGTEPPKRPDTLGPTDAGIAKPQSSSGPSRGGQQNQHPFRTAATGPSSGSGGQRPVRCYNCNGHGHIAAHCPKPLKKQAVRPPVSPASFAVPGVESKPSVHAFASQQGRVQTSRCAASVDCSILEV